MLDVVLLKGRHWYHSEAKKHLPYIEITDLFSIENSGYSEAEAADREREWMTILNTPGISLNQFREASKLDNQSRGSPQAIDFAVTIDCYLFKRRIPLWHVERFPPEEAQKAEFVKDASSTFFFLQDKGTQALYEGNLPTYFHDCLLSLVIMKKSGVMRDRNMARNIDHAEEKIRQFYPQLRKKDPLVLTIQLGALHPIEKYTSIPIKVHSFYEGPPDAGVALSAYYFSTDNHDPEELRVRMLRSGVRNLVCGGTLQFPEPEIEKMDYNALVNLLRERVWQRKS